MVGVVRKRRPPEHRIAQVNSTVAATVTRQRGVRHGAIYLQSTCTGRMHAPRETSSFCGHLISHAFFTFFRFVHSLRSKQRIPLHDGTSHQCGIGLLAV
jgi:hypothetical protein